MLRAIITIFLFQIASTAWAESFIKWSRDRYGTVSCVEYTPGGDAIGQVDHTRCRDLYLPVNKWTRDRYGTISCGEYTPDSDYHMGSVEFNLCRISEPTHPEWMKDRYGTVSCAELTPSGYVVETIDSDICRNKNSNSVMPNGLKKLTIEQVNQALQPPEGGQVILTGDLAVPRNQGCAAPKDTDKNFQCYVCQAQSSRNSMLYTKDGILGLGTVQMNESRTEIRVALVDSDDLGSIRCISKNKSQIQINTLEELTKALELSGLKYKEPAAIMKKIGVQRSEQ